MIARRSRWSFSVRSGGTYMKKCVELTRGGGSGAGRHGAVPSSRTDSGGTDASESGAHCIEDSVTPRLNCGSYFIMNSRGYS